LCCSGAAIVTREIICLLANLADAAIERNSRATPAEKDNS